MKKEIRDLAERFVRDHLSEPNNVAEHMEAGEYLSDTDLDVDENVDDFYEAIKDELAWIVARLDQRTADRGVT